MGLRDVLLGKKKLAGPARERLFALTTAAVTMQTELGLRTAGAAGICFKPLSAGEFVRAENDLQQLLDSPEPRQLTIATDQSALLRLPWELLADDAGYSANWVSNDDDRRKLIDASDWVLITRNKRFVEELETSAFVETIVVPPKLRLWTDDYNNLSQILRPISFDKDEGK